MIAERETTESVGAAVLGADGYLARALPHYEARQAQIEMADLVADAMQSGQHALIEAGTGTGKSFGYLIPSIYAAVRDGKRVIVSTDTIQLQEQLVQKDLPFLARILEPILGRTIRFAMAKGRSHYFCERNAIDLTEQTTLQEDLAAMAATALLREFQSERWDGDEATLKIAVTPGQWSMVSGEDSCEGRNCKYAKLCGYQLNKAAREQADIVITNHTMYLMHCALKTRGINVLPEHTVWIADEAHTLADKAVEIFGTTLKHDGVRKFVKKLKRQAKILDLSLEDVDPVTLERANDQFFQHFHGATKDEVLFAEFPPEVLASAEQAMLHVVALLEPLRRSLHKAAASVRAGCVLADLSPRDRERLQTLERLRATTDGLCDAFQAFFGTPDPEFIHYAEVVNHSMRGIEVTLQRKPIETAWIFRDFILPDLESAVFCSATLASGVGAATWKSTLDDFGLSGDEVRTLQVESPFDYTRQVRGYVPGGLPEARSMEYHTALADEVVKILNHTQGRAFVLFTSNYDMRRVGELVMTRVRFPILTQGDKQKDLLIEEFKNTPNAVLFGVKTFWTGVDVPGQALSCVILCKLPFPSPAAPLNKARMDRIKSRGLNDFREFMLPRCIRDVRQGFGRLIRSKTDTGLFVILDPRMRTANYGRDIAASLPNFPCTSTLEGGSL